MGCPLAHRIFTWSASPPKLPRSLSEPPRTAQSLPGASQSLPEPLRASNGFSGASQSLPGAYQGCQCIFTTFLCCGRHIVCIFTIYSILRQASCMHFYDIFYVAAGTLYAFYDIFYVAAGTFYAYLRYICDKRARHVLSTHIYDMLCDNPFFVISMIRCMKMTLPLCCGRRLHAFFRYILRLERHFTSITEGLYD